MADRTKIEWTRGDDGSPGATWNPVTGCTKVSAGCDHCYAETIAHRFDGTPAYPYGFSVTLRPERLNQPLRWKRPRRIFVNSMSDLFHRDIPDQYIAEVFAVMAAARQHTFQVLTKRHGRMRSLLSSDAFIDMFDEHYVTLPGALMAIHWPLENVWLGVSVENQAAADLRIPALLDTPAETRFLSCEPLLGPVHLDDGQLHLLDWVIVGGESGHGARPMQGSWARELRDECSSAGIPFLFKQWGEYDETASRIGKKAAGRILDGRTWDEYPS